MTAEPLPVPAPLRRLLGALHVDAAVLYALLARAWQIVAGPVTLLVVAQFLSPQAQGFYYTFASVVALQSFVELGLYLVIISLASHEWARLRLEPDGTIAGDPAALSRLVSLGRLVFGWYAAVSAVFAIGVGAIGWWFFGSRPAAGIEWQGPWAALVALSAVLLWALPFNSLLEGCDQLRVINRFRLGQAVLSSIAVWLTLAFGGGLWALAAGTLVAAARDAHLLLFRYRRFFAPFWRQPAGPRLGWRREVWPMQWRLAAMGVVNYFAYALFNPVMFRHHGAEAAGRMGMTLQVVMSLQMIALAWIQTRTPRFGALVAQRQFRALDALWRSVSLVAAGVFVLGAATFLAILAALRAAGLPLADRMLDPLPTALLLLATLLMVIGQCQAAYLRAHKREPLVVSGVVSSLVIGLAVWELGRRFGAVGASGGYLTIVAVLALPWTTIIWQRSRSRWHRQPGVPGSAAVTT